MSKRTATPLQSKASVIYDQVLTTDDGKILRMVVDVSRINEDAGQYHQHLLFARNIPFDIPNITPLDPMVRVVSEMMPFMRSDSAEIVRMAKAHYQALSDEAYRHAMMLAVSASPENVFTEEPKPWPPQNGSELPGIPALPMPEYNLFNPVERRLKQLWDFLESDVKLLGKFYVAFNDALVRVNQIGLSQEIDEKGFQPQPVN